MRTPPISVLLFSNTTVRAGVEEHILELLRGLDREKFRLYLACPAELLQKYGNDIPRDVQVAPILIDSILDFRGAMQLARMLRRHKIDILHSHQFNASFFASPIGWFCRVPVIIETSHSCEVWRKGWLKSKYIVDRLAGCFVDYYIAVSRACGDFLAKKKKLPASKIRVILNGCNLEKYDPARPVPIGMRQALGFGERDPILVALARLEPQKGHHVLLDAMPEVLREFPTARLVCVGDGILQETLEKQTDLLGIREAVRFVGYQSNVPDWLALADFTVLPSYYEGLPLVAIESLAAGRTMVATAVDGTPDVIINGKTGLTVPPGDSKRMADAICALLRNPTLRQTLAQAGRRYVLEAFSSQRFVQQTAQLYLDAWDRCFGHSVASRIGEIGQLGGRLRRNQETQNLAPKNLILSCVQSEFPTVISRDPSDGSATSGAAKQAICRHIVEHCLSVYGNRLRAIVLAGSLARNEGTFIRVGKGWKLLGDADCFLVFQENALLPSDSEIVSLQCKIEGRLAEGGLSGKIGLSAVTPRFLKNLTPLISTFELRNSGQVLWGEHDILSLIPNFSESEIAREDAWRMLCNRMIEQLAFAGDLSNVSTEMPPELHYATVKLFLDMATSYLVFAGHYAPSFQERSKRLSALAERSSDDAPFPLKKFAARVAEFTLWKVSGEEGDCDRRMEFWHEAISYMRRLWRWEVIHLTGVRGEMTISALSERLSKGQTPEQRLRGWLSVAKRRGYLKSWRSWPRWVRLSFSSTPRYLVYRAAAEIAFRLPCLIKHSGQPPRLDVDWRDVQALLPEQVQRAKSDEAFLWREIVDDIIWNYSEFLLGTRA